MQSATSGVEGASSELMADAQEFAQKLGRLLSGDTIFGQPDESTGLAAILKAFMDQRAKGESDMATVLAEVAPFVERFAPRAAEENTGMSGQELHDRVVAALQGRGLEPRPSLIALRREERERCARLSCNLCAERGRPVLRHDIWWHGEPPKTFGFWASLSPFSPPLCDAARIWDLIAEEQ